MKKKRFWISLIAAVVLALGAFSLTACGGGDTYSVTFELNGAVQASAPETQSVKSGGVATDPGAPNGAPDGKVFAYWSLSENGTAYSFDTPVTSHITLYAVWANANISVTFDYNNGSVSQVSSVPYNTTVSKPQTDPVKQDAEFVGWYYGGKEFNFTTAVTSDITLTATYGYRVTFMANGDEHDSMLVIEGDKASMPTDPADVPNSDGSEDRFFTWMNGATEYDFSQGVNSPLTLTAQYKTSYFVYFMYNYYGTENAPAGVPSSNIDPDFGEEYEDDYYIRYEIISDTTIGDNALAASRLPGLTSGATFEGWYLNKECTQAYADSTPIQEGQNTYVYAKWAAPLTSNKYFVFNNVSGSVYVSFNREYKDAIPNPLYIPGEYCGSPVRILQYGFQALSNLSGWLNTEGGADSVTNDLDNVTVEVSSSLRNVVIGEGVTEIGAYAFYNDLFIEKLVLPETLVTIGTYAFGAEGTFSPITEVRQAIWYEGGELVIPASVRSIGQYAFRYLAMNKVTFESGSNLSSIPAYAFLLCINIEEFVLPDKLTNIDTFALSSLYSLRSISFPATLRSLGTYALFNAKNLESVVFEDGCPNLTMLPERCFYGAEKLKSIDVSNTKITDFGQYCFGNSGLTSFAFKSGVTVIYPYMFAGAKDLSQVTFGSARITTIGASAFDGCKSLTSIDLPVSVAVIDMRAFADSGLTSIVIPRSCNKFGSYPFAGCNDLKQISVNASNVYFKSDANNKGVYSYDGKVLYITAAMDEGETFEVAEGCTEIFDYAFFNNKTVTKVTLPGTLKKIGYGAFGGATAENVPQITSLVIPASVTEIGQYAFAHTRANVTFAAGSQITEIPEYGFVWYNGDTIYIPANIESIGSAAFMQSSASSIVFEENSNLKYISNSAFSQMDNLVAAGTEEKIDANKASKTLELPDGLEVIGNHSFYGAVTGYPVSRASAPDFENLVIPDSVVIVGDYSFVDDINLKNVTFGSGIMYLGNYAFHNNQIVTADLSAATNLRVIGNYTFYYGGVVKTNDNEVTYYSQRYLREVIFPELDQHDSDSQWATNYATNLSGEVTNVNFNATKGLTIANCAFYNAAVEEFTLPYGTVAIGSSAFARVKADSANSDVTAPTDPDPTKPDPVVDDVTNRPLKINAKTAEGGTVENALPETVTLIGSSAFGYTKLSALTLPSKLTTLGTSVFRYSAIESMVIPASVTELGQYAFQGCSELTSVEFEANSKVTVIDLHTFVNCPKLTSVTLPAGLRDISANSFVGTAITGFEFAEGTPAAFSIIDGDIYTLNGKTLIAAAASNEKLIKQVENKTVYTVRDGVTEISNYALSALRADEIVFPVSVVSLEQNAGNGNANLKTLTFANNNPNTISIGRRAFMQAVNISTINFGNNKFNLGTFAFQSTGVKNIQLPQGVTEIVDGLFYACALDEIDLTGITKIGSWAFASYGEYYGNLQSINIPESVLSLGEQETFRGSHAQTITFAENSKITEIPMSCFSGCSFVSEFTLPASIRSIGMRAFAGCSELTTLTVNASTVVTLGSEAFTDSNKLANIFVPANLVNSYKSAAGWSAYADIIKAIPAQGDANEAAEVQSVLAVRNATGANSLPETAPDFAAMPRISARKEKFAA